MKHKDIIDMALEIIEGYCKKHSECARCRFYNHKDYDCIFSKGEIPCDWSVENDR